MKKILLPTLALFAIGANAQLPNPGFENRRTNGAAANWQPSSVFVIPVDSNCLYLGWDSLQTPTNDAHSGLFAQEVRVATACGDTYSGSITSARYDSTGFLDQRIPISGQPSAFTFYYKLYPVQGDYGLAEAFMEDEAGSAIGEGLIQLTAASSWTAATLPMQYFTGDTSGRLRLRFSIGNAAAPHYGTRFVIDDIAQESPTGIAGVPAAAGTLYCFPTHAPNTVHIRMEDAIVGADAILIITDFTGRIVRRIHQLIPENKTIAIDTQPFSAGIYCVRLTTTGRVSIGRFIK